MRCPSLAAAVDQVAGTHQTGWRSAELAKQQIQKGQTMPELGLEQTVVVQLQTH